MDYWGKEWSYAKEQCEKNAKLEGVAAQGHFQKGDAAKLDFPDETFDAGRELSLQLPRETKRRVPFGLME